MCAEESSCPTSLDDVGADIWRPDLLIDFQDELNIIAQDIFELKPANWDYLEEAMTEESTVNYEKWMKSPAISRRDEMMPGAVGLNPHGSRRAATQELLNKARQKHRAAKDPPDLSTQKFYPGNYDKRMYRTTRTVTFGSSLPPPPVEVVAESSRKSSSSSSNLPRVEYMREECRTKNIYRIHKRPKFKPKVTCVLENGEVGSLSVTLAEAEGISQPGHFRANGVQTAGDLPPGQTAGVLPPGQTAGVLSPSQTAGDLQPGQTAGVLPPSQTAGVLHPSQTAGVLQPSQAGEFRSKRKEGTLSKKQHNSAERIRRVELAESFRDLARLLPHFKQTVKEKPILSKQQILSESRSFCIQLQRSVKTLELEVKEEQLRNRLLRDTIKNRIS